MAILSVALSMALSLQLSTSAGHAPHPPTSARAVRVVHAPVIDGSDSDEVWRAAPAITGFRQARPAEDGEPTFPTSLKVAYDPQNLYVFVRCFDPHPDSIVGLLARRDVETQSDWVWLFIDSYHDRRTGFEFGVNPAGVKIDYALYDDQNEDVAWDGVWEVRTRIDSLGWTAEFRIPLSQLKFTTAPSLTFGLGLWRDIQRRTERVTWPLWRQSEQGFVHQFGEITGLDGLHSPRRAELTPYMVTKNLSDPAQPDQPDPGPLARRRPQVRRGPQPHVERDDQPRFRTSRGRSFRAEPDRVRDLLPGAAAVLRRGTGPVQFHGQLQCGE